MKRLLFSIAFFALVLSAGPFVEQAGAETEEAGEARPPKMVRAKPRTTRADANGIRKYRERRQEMNAKRVVVDSMTHFARLTQDPIELRSVEYDFINALKREGLTSLLTKESPVLLGESTEDGGLGFVVDSYLVLRYVEIESAIHKALFVLKMRGSNHATDIRQYDILEHGIEVQSRFEGQEGILSGSPRRMAESFVQAFVKK